MNENFYFSSSSEASKREQRKVAAIVKYFVFVLEEMVKNRKILSGLCRVL